MTTHKISDIKEKTRYLLWAKSAGRCEFDGCNHPLYEDDLTHIEANFGDLAHIIGQGEKGPRSFKERKNNKQYINNIENLMLVCKTHHKLIDDKPEQFPVDLLRKMKHYHEERIKLATDMKVDKASNVLIFRGRIGTFQPIINFHDAKQALFPDFYAAKDHPIELSMDGVQLSDDDPSYWEMHTKNLENSFHKKMNHFLEDNHERNHFSIFAFAPIPLLIKLGTLIPDHYPTQVYQLKKEPQNWSWEQNPDDFDFVITEPKDKHDLIVLNLSLSADIESQRIFDTLKTETVSIWKMDINETPFPKNDHLRGKGQLILFSRYIRKLINQIKAEYGQDKVLHIFPAIPLAYAVELGRVRQAKADLPLMVYDQNNKSGGFIPALKIN